ncbi:putative MFS family arabinose efflux permease [Actinocorallia herbida]|uniref:Putative MFS family arabinose efflux permease n=1 Tax=Actinocorallia herbida TaxID=58109 RepID=A0A3N1D2E8_9ACTN|nr:MFS transporter [Actinocorallia herbida]ROO87705.1 putative MFS family arabinose efflux permease [Actinocorallia herbida]
MRKQPWAVRLLLVNQFGVNTGFYLLIPYLATHLTDSLGMSAALVGVVLGVRNLSQQGLFLIGGSAADRLGARRVIIAGCALRAVGFALFALGTSLPVLLGAAALSGVAGALFNPAVRAYIAVESDDKAAAFALFNVFAQAGALFGPLLGAAPLFVDFRLSALVAAGIFTVLTAAQALALPAREVPPRDTTVLGDWRRCLTDRRFLAFTLALSGMFALQNQLYLVLPLAARDATGRAESAALLFLVGTAATLLLQVRITRQLSCTKNRYAVMAAGLAVMGAGFLAPALLPGLVPVLLAVVCLEIGVIITQPFAYALIGDVGGERLSGTYFGVFYLVSGVVAAASTALIGAAEGAGAFLCAAIGLLCALGALAIGRRAALRPV